MTLAGVPQEPWLDDNGDGIADRSDGQIAADRYIVTTLGGFGPTIQNASVPLSGTTGTLTAQVERGAQEIDLVWAAVYAPSFQEPVSTTLGLGVPIVLLQEDSEQEGLYRATYAGGFDETGEYRVIFYAQDQAGMHAPPRRVVVKPSWELYLPLVLRGQ